MLISRLASENSSDLACSKVSYRQAIFPFLTALRDPPKLFRLTRLDMQDNLDGQRFPSVTDSTVVRIHGVMLVGFRAQSHMSTCLSREILIHDMRKVRLCES